MTTQINKQIKTTIVAALNQINTASGFNTNPTILSGWMSHHAASLINGVDGKSFPAVTVQYDKDANSQNKGSSDNNLSRTLLLTGAVITDDPDVVNDALDDLLFDVKVALFNNDEHRRRLTLGEVEFMLPDNNASYAMFSLKVTITLTEKLKND